MSTQSIKSIVPLSDNVLGSGSESTEDPIEDPDNVLDYRMNLLSDADTDKLYVREMKYLAKRGLLCTITDDGEHVDVTPEVLDVLLASHTQQLADTDLSGDNDSEVDDHSQIGSINANNKEQDLLKHKAIF